jgi:DNA invertase Pin-like site-specific DNA recombinase
MAILGYARVSTDHQSLDQQHDALTAAGVDRVFTDKISGTRDDRPGLAALLDYARDGDTVVVVALDRLGRSLAGIVRTIETLRERGVMLRSLREGIDYSTPVGRMVAGIFASLAEYERELIHERAAVARQAARARGRQIGRPRALTSDQIRLAQRMREAGEPVSVICTALKVARSTLYRALGNVEQAGGGARGSSASTDRLQPADSQFA